MENSSKIAVADSRARRWLLFGVGLLLAGTGVAMSTRPQLGTSPISSLPYVTTLCAPWSLGCATVAVNVLFILVQAWLLGHSFGWRHLLQLPTLVAFGVCIDLGMWLTSLWVPESYVLRLLETVLGCVVLAAGIAMQLRADISMMPGDSLIRVVSDKWRLQFGLVKICFDSAIVLSAIAVSLCFLHRVEGVREGTVLAALLVGTFVRLMGRVVRVRSAR